MNRITLEDGKYTIVSSGGKCHAFRYGESWRDLTGDKMIGALLSENERLTAERDAPKEALPTAASPEANAAIEAMLKQYNWPCNTQNAGRAGWEAARKYLGGALALKTQESDDPKYSDIVSDGGLDPRNAKEKKL